MNKVYESDYNNNPFFKEILKTEEKLLIQSLNEMCCIDDKVYKLGKKRNYLFIRRNT